MQEAVSILKALGNAAMVIDWLVDWVKTVLTSGTARAWQSAALVCSALGTAVADCAWAVEWAGRACAGNWKLESIPSALLEKLCGQGCVVLIGSYIIKKILPLFFSMHSVRQMRA